ncbi:MAG: hypothetical protein CME62_07090 [Halobacteriovoraceae bacterium]|nr:hypothetical protein [Halobacteriovoraceae bacterium]|tara:strand:- start:4995 stop:5738 length:744 start_codon:yes stop_codon:yes gene_type:complete
MDKMRVFTFFLLLSTQLWAQNFLTLSAQKIISHHKCHQEIDQYLKSWQSTFEFEKYLGDDLSEIKLITPTKSLGKWIIAEFKNNQVKLSLRTDFDQLEVKLAKNCQKEIGLHKLKRRQQQDSFQKEDLAQLLQKNEKGMIYIWSPHMPLSIAGIKEIKKAAKKTKMPVTILLDQNVSREFAKKTLKSHGLSESYLKSYNTIELALRGASLHLPSVLLYKNHQIVRRAKPGHEYTWKFIQYIEKWVSK